MEGTITFKDIDDLAAFLKAFTGSTATFVVHEIDKNIWLLTFTGGY